MKYRDFVNILTKHGFQLERERATHKQYKGVVDGMTRLVTVDYAQPGEDVRAKNLASVIRQSGLPKKSFR